MAPCIATFYPFSTHVQFFSFSRAHVELGRERESGRALAWRGGGCGQNIRPFSLILPSSLSLARFSWADGRTDDGLCRRFSSPLSHCCDARLRRRREINTHFNFKAAFSSRFPEAVRQLRPDEERQRLRSAHLLLTGCGVVGARELQS